MLNSKNYLDFFVSLDMSGKIHLQNEILRSVSPTPHPHLHLNCPKHRWTIVYFPCIPTLVTSCLRSVIFASL